MSCDEKLKEGLDQTKSLYHKKEFRRAVETLEEVLSTSSNRRLLSEAHLLLAKCHKGLGDLKTSISCCNSAIEQNSKWKEPYLYRSATFQALHTAFLETDGDTSENIARDRASADIIVDISKEPTDVGRHREEEAKRRLLRKNQEKVPLFVNKLDEALRLAENGQKIFIEAGVYTVSAGEGKGFSSFYVFGKNLSLIGASTKDCILLYKKELEPESSASLQPSAPKLETFLICAGAGDPTLIKRLTFRNDNSSSVKTKFFGVGGGHVQIEDCMFDGVMSSEVDAVYANSAICGSLAHSYPPPRVSIRFCIFDHCQSYGTATFSRSCGSLSSSYFINCGRSAVTAMDAAKVSVLNCDFGQTELTESVVSSTGSDITVSGCYLQGIQVGQLEALSSQAVAVSLKSVARIENNYIYKTGTGISVHNSDASCLRNLIYSCSRRYSQNTDTTLGLYSGLAVRGPGKVSLGENLVKQCDVGVHIAENSSPAIRDNVVDSSFYAGVFVESESRPNLVSNTFHGGDAGSLKSSLAPVVRGIGVLFILGAKGLLGKNQFEDFSVSPVMVFTKCQPMLKQNSYININISEERQEKLEKDLIAQFHNELQQDSYFYIIESKEKEEALWEQILKGVTVEPE